MAAILVSAAVTCVAALALGQVALRLAGAREWSWLAPPVGISILMLIAAAAIYVPGRCVTVGVVLGGLTLGAIAWCWRAPAHRPPLLGLLAAAPVALLVLVPFFAAGHPGTLGTGLNNDMYSHLLWAEGYSSRAVANITPLPPDYPLGPHAVAAVVSKGIGVRMDQAFAGVSMALPIVNAWTALALVSRASWSGKVAAATVVGMPYLVAAYYGQGAFKEVLMANLVLAFVLLLSGYGPALGRGRWVPLALVIGGVLSVYSVLGLPWVLLIGGLWLIVVGMRCVAQHGRKGLAAAVRRELPAVGIGCTVLVASLLPQLQRLERFISLRVTENVTGLPEDGMGNLVGALPGWEAFGVWSNPDFRSLSPAFYGRIWTAFALALVLVGVVWALRRGRWMLPLAAAASMSIWVVSAFTLSIYVTSKALILASPLLIAIAVLPLVDGGPNHVARSLLAPVLALVLVVLVVVSDVRALQVSPVGPTDHMSELRSLRPTLGDRPTLFLGNDDFVEWELAGVPVQAPAVNPDPGVRLRPRKAWGPAKALDFDSVDPATLNHHDWVITTRDAAGSAPPPELRLVRTTGEYALWRRTGKVEERSVLPEGDMAGAALDCHTRTGREVLHGGGVAAVRNGSLVVPAPSVAPSTSASTQLSLDPGAWELETQYTSLLPVAVTADGLSTTLPPNLDRAGPRWRIGRLTVRDRHPVTVTFHVDKTLFTSSAAAATMLTLVATPLTPERVVPVRAACDRYVDWYRPASDERGSRATRRGD